jgi:tRNA(Arg) A34 adenosine deaminase TadA
VRINRTVALIAAYDVRAVHNREVSVLYNHTNRSLIAWAIDTREHPHDTATSAVNLQRGLAERRDLTGLVIVSTSIPTVMCLGMCALTHVKEIFARADRALWSYPPGNDLTRVEMIVDPDVTSAEAEWLTRCLSLIDRNDRVGLHAAVMECPDRTVLAAIDAIPTSVIRDFVVGQPPAPNQPIAQQGTAAMDAYWMRVARRLTAEVHFDANLNLVPRTGHNIGCILVSETNHILAWGVNTNTHNATRHAETKCMWMFQRLNPGAKLPARSTLYTTLQSCLMCSAMIKHAADDQPMRVVYGDADKVQNSVLTRGGGARETPLVHIIPDNAPLEMRTGVHMLALARWDRLRQTVRNAPSPPAAMRLLRGASPETLDRDVQALNAAVKRKVRGLLDEDSTMAHLRTAMSARDADRSVLRAQMQAREDALRNQVESNPTYAKQRLSLERRQRELRELQDFAFRSPQARQGGFGSGAPALLQNANVLRVLDSTIAEFPRPDDERTLAQELLDVNTGLYVVRFLESVLHIVRDYAQS